MTKATKQVKQPWIIQHRGLWINLASILLVIGLDNFAFPNQHEILRQPSALIMIMALLLIFEPWAIYYSMKAFNRRRNQLDLKIPRLQRNLKGPLGILLWAGRISIYSAFLTTLLNSHYGGLEQVPEWLHITAIISIFIRESWIVFWFINTKVDSNFREGLTWLADLILLAGLVLGEWLVFKVFKDMGLDGKHSTMEYLELLFPIVLLCLIFYVPIRFLYTLEDITFAQSNWEKWERLISFLLVFISFLVLGPSLAN